MGSRLESSDDEWYSEATSKSENIVDVTRSDGVERKDFGDESL